MMRMIRSARTRIHQGETRHTDSCLMDGFASSQPVGPWPFESLSIHVDGEETEERPLKRANGLCGPARSRLSRTRSNVESSHQDSENMCVDPQPPAPAPLPVEPSSVLGDVTNSRALQPYHEKQKSEWVPPKPELREASSLVVPSQVAPVSRKVLLPEVKAPAAPSLGCTAAEDPQQAVLGDDPHRVSEYVPDIYRHLHKQETQRAQPRYMELQVHVNAKMRGILVDWLVDVHKKYKLKAETLFLAVATIDRYLERQVTQKRHLQLVGVTALLIASKYEETYPPHINELVYVTDKAYTREEVLKMETCMLNKLDFQVSQPTATHFLTRFEMINKSCPEHRAFAQYLLELTLIDYKMIRFAPSHVAAASIYLTNKLLRSGRTAWTESMLTATKIAEPALKECAKELCVLFDQAEHGSLQAVRKKFSLPKYHKVSSPGFVHEHSPNVRERVRLRRKCGGSPSRSEAVSRQACPHSMEDADDMEL